MQLVSSKWTASIRKYVAQELFYYILSVKYESFSVDYVFAMVFACAVPLHVALALSMASVGSLVVEWLRLRDHQPIPSRDRLHAFHNNSNTNSNANRNKIRTLTTPVTKECVKQHRCKLAFLVLGMVFHWLPSTQRFVSLHCLYSLHHMTTAAKKTRINVRSITITV